MIRKLKETDIDKVVGIWLNENLKAHNFISELYWIDNLETVKNMLPEAEVYVYEEENDIWGFIGLNQEFISGIFICSNRQSIGVGKKLLDYVKSVKSKLLLHVYVKNKRAIQFYRREKFKIVSESMDENTGEKEYFMMWNS